MVHHLAKAQQQSMKNLKNIATMLLRGRQASDNGIKSTSRSQESVIFVTLGKSLNLSEPPFTFS